MIQQNMVAQDALYMMQKGKNVLDKLKDEAQNTVKGCDQCVATVSPDVAAGVRTWIDSIVSSECSRVRMATGLGLLGAYR